MQRPSKPRKSKQRKSKQKASKYRKGKGKYNVLLKILKKIPKLEDDTIRKIIETVKENQEEPMRQELREINNQIEANQTEIERLPRNRELTVRQYDQKFEDLGSTARQLNKQYRKTRESHKTIKENTF